MAKQGNMDKTLNVMRRWLAAIWMVIFSSSALAAPGDLDAGFGGVGWVSAGFPLQKTWDTGRSVIKQADDKLVVAGYSSNGLDDDIALVRYNADGTLDTTFDGDGKVTTAMGAADDDVAYSVIQQMDGKLVVAGYSHNGSNTDIALLRYNSDGSLDASFDVDGKVITTVLGSSYDYAYSVIQQTDGKLVVVGEGFYLAVLRYNSNGSLDTSFDGDGKFIVMDSNHAAYSVIQQVDGKLVVTGNSYNAVNRDIIVLRLNNNGSLDTTFDGDGKVTTAMGVADDIAYSVVQQADGKLVVAGISNVDSRLKLTQVSRPKLTHPLVVQYS